MSAVILGGKGIGKSALVALRQTRQDRAGSPPAAIVREVAPIIGGGGGGRDDMAQAGGKEPSKLDEALAAAREAIERDSFSRCVSWPSTTARRGSACAISDPSGTLATPLPVIEPPEPRSVAELVAKHEVERVVVGLPLHLSGEEGAQAALTRGFCAELEAMLDVPGGDLRRALDDADGGGEQARGSDRAARLPRRRAPLAGLPRGAGRDRSPEDDD
jgi:hypothetical protein